MTPGETIKHSTTMRPASQRRGQPSPSRSLVQFDLKSLDLPATASSPIRSRSISTPQLARLFILSFSILYLSTLHLSSWSTFPFQPSNIFVYLQPFHIHGSPTATAITFIPLLPSGCSISFQRLDRVLLTTTKYLNSPQQIPSCPLARPTSSS